MINLRKESNRREEKLPPIRIKESEKRTIEAEAERLGMNLTDFLRLCIEQYFKNKTSDKE